MRSKAWVQLSRLDCEKFVRMIDYEVIVGDPTAKTATVSMSRFDLMKSS